MLYLKRFVTNAWRIGNSFTSIDKLLSPMALNSQDLPGTKYKTAIHLI
jgi:hypothetical protein